MSNEGPRPEKTHEKVGSAKHEELKLDDILVEHEEARQIIEENKE